MTPVAARLAELRLAVMLLTRLPVGRFAAAPPPLNAAIWAYPLVGLPIGAVIWVVSAGAIYLTALPAMIAAVLALGAMLMATGGLHADGLADTADGLGGGRDRAHCLEIMKDSRIGAYGVMALGVVLALWALGLAQIWAGGPARHTLIGVLGVCVASRVCMAAVLVWMPSAREGGLGDKAAGGSGKALVPGAVLAVALLWPVIGVCVPMIAVTAYLAWRAQRRIGGQTGDVLGAVQLASEAAGLIAVQAMM